MKIKTFLFIYLTLFTAYLCYEAEVGFPRIERRAQAAHRVAR